MKRQYDPAITEAVVAYGQALEDKSHEELLTLLRSTVEQPACGESNSKLEIILELIRHRSEQMYEERLQIV